MTPVLHPELPYAVWTDPAMWRLPGVAPAGPDDWLQVDAAYAGQMALRDALVVKRPAAVVAMLDNARSAAEEMLENALDWARRHGGYHIGADQITRPDGVTIRPDSDTPLITLARLFQQDLCLMERHGDAHVLTGAALCFPASWTLAEKLGKPLDAIHRPVPEYHADLAKRVQRLFDAIAVDRPLWRANALFYNDPALHQPRSEGATHRAAGAEAAYLRSEKQVLKRLPRTGAVVFSIHTWLVARTALSVEQAKGLASARVGTV
ncbi:MAG: DUF3445 domain-containing protein [Pseudomonadota bacterium]